MKSSKLGQKVGHILLRKKIKQLKRLKSFHNFDTARTIGVLFDATQQENYSQAKEFIQFLSLKKIEVSGLGFVVNQDAIGYFPYQKGIEYFSINDTNWYAFPKNKVAHDFLEQPFDMLIDITLFDNFTLQYIFALSKAKFKISKKYKFNFADFTIDIEHNGVEATKDYFIKQLKHYLSSISANH